MNEVQLPAEALMGFLSLLHASRPLSGPTQLPIQWVPWAFTTGLKRAGRETDHSPPSSVEVKNVLSYASAPPIRLHGVVLRQLNTRPTLLHFQRYMFPNLCCCLYTD